MILASRYRPHLLSDAKARPDRCPAAVYDNRAGSHQCLNKRGSNADGWCKTHEPERIRARREKASANFKKRVEAEQKEAVVRGLQDATSEQLQAELNRRKNRKSSKAGRVLLTFELDPKQYGLVIDKNAEYVTLDKLSDKELFDLVGETGKGVYSLNLCRALKLTKIERA